MQRSRRGHIFWNGNSMFSQFGQPVINERQDLQLPENLLPVAAVGFLAGLVGALRWGYNTIVIWPRFWWPSLLYKFPTSQSLGFWIFSILRISFSVRWLWLRQPQQQLLLQLQLLLLDRIKNCLSKVEINVLFDVRVCIRVLVTLALAFPRSFFKNE